MNKRIFPVTVVTIILAVFLAISFLIYDNSEKVYIAGVTGSYAENYARQNGIDFIELPDSENPKVEIPEIEKRIETQNEREPIEGSEIDDDSELYDSENPDVTVPGTEETVNDKEVTGSEATEDIKTEAPTTEESDSTVKPEKDNSKFAYNYVGETVEIKLYKGSDSIIVIPSTIDNLPVTSVSMPVLNRGISAVFIPESVMAIDTKFKTERYGASFFSTVAVMVAGYIFAIISTFIGFRKNETSQGTFYGMPFVYGGLTSYIVLAVLCAVFLAFKVKPFIQIITAIAVFGLTIVGLVSKSVARDKIEAIDSKTKAQTQFINSIITEADSLMKNTTSLEGRTLVKKVYEAVRYSDPVSTLELNDMESDIKDRFSYFESLIQKNDMENAQIVADELQNLIAKRNAICKAGK